MENPVTKLIQDAIQRAKLEIKIDADREVLSVTLSRLIDLDKDRAVVYDEAQKLLGL